MKKSVLLARVSSKAQEEDGYSLDAQEKLLTEYCANNKLESRKIFRITETAAKEKERKIFRQAIEYASSKDCKVLVVEKVDRLTRSFKDMVLVDDWMHADEDREVHLVKDGLVLHKNSRSQELLNWGVKVLFAKNYVDNLREEVRKGQQEKLAQGWLPGSPPYGYKTIGDAGKKIHIIDPKTAPLAKRVFEEYLKPDGSIRIVKKWADINGLRTKYNKPFPHSSLSDQILKNPFYKGVNRWCGVEYPGVQEKIISEETFEAVQVKLRGKSTSHKLSKHKPTYRGIFTCSGCSGLITWEFQKLVWYGHCNHYRDCPRKKWVRKDTLELQLKDYLKDLECPDPAIIDWIVDELSKSHQGDMRTKQLSLAALRSEYDSKKRMLDLSYEDRLIGRITPEKYDERVKSTNCELLELEARIKDVENEHDVNMQNGIKFLTDSQTYYDLFRNGGDETKRSILMNVFSELRLDGDTLYAEYDTTASAVFETVKKHKKLIKDFRTNKKDPNNRSWNELNAAIRSTWLLGSDSNRQPSD